MQVRKGIVGTREDLANEAALGLLETHLGTVPSVLPGRGACASRAKVSGSRFQAEEGGGAIVINASVPMNPGSQVQLYAGTR